MNSELSPELAAHLRACGVIDVDEVSLRRLLDESVPGWTLIRLNAIAAKRWKARYRLLLGEQWYDAATVSNTYALALLALMQAEEGEPADV